MIQPTPAQLLQQHGCSIIPVRKDKRPSWDLLPQTWDEVQRRNRGQWKPFQLRRPTDEELTKWTSAHTPAYAIVTGGISRRITLDFDGEAGTRLAKEWGIKPHRRTGSGGFHLDVVHPGWYVPTLNGKAKAQLGEKWPGLDIKADGGYAIALGSNENGSYVWLRDPEPDSMDVVPAEVWEFLAQYSKPTIPNSVELTDAAASGTGGKANYGGAARVNSERLILKAVEAVALSGRNNAGFDLACQLRDNGYSEPEALSVMCTYRSQVPSVNSKGQPEPYSDAEINATIREAFSKPPRAPWSPSLSLGNHEPSARRVQAEKNQGDRAASKEGHWEGTQTTAQVTDEWPEYVPLQTYPVAKLSGDIFPGCLGRMIAAVSESTETPPELAAMLALGVVSLSIAGKVEVSPTVNPDYKETVNLYCCAAMEPGNRKTSVLNFLTEPVIEWEKRQADSFPYRKDLISERKTIEMQIDNLRKRKRSKGEPIEALHAEIRDLEAKLPDVPSVPQLWSQDITPEHLGTRLAEQEEKLALLSAEGGVFENFAGRYSKNNVPNIDLLLQAYDGSPSRVERAGRTVFLRRPTLTIAISPQPDVLIGMQNHKEFRARGLVGRFLYALPASPIGERPCADVAIPYRIRADYRQKITDLLNMPVSRNAHGHIEPEVLPLSKPAMQLWKDFQLSTEQAMREGNRLFYCRDWGGKLPGKVARIAASLYAISYPWADRPSEIQLEEISAAVTIVELLTSHALAVFGLMNIDTTVEQALKITKWLQTEKKEIFSLRDSFHRFQRLFTRISNIQPCLALLVEHGYIQSLGKPEGKKTELYRVCPRVLGFQE